MSAPLSDSRLTDLIAQGTGEILKGVRGVGLLRGRALGETGDELAHNWIARVLKEHRPDDGFLSEEASDNAARLNKNRVWVIDPLDGTKEFATGRQDWAVHIALIIDGVPQHAAVGLPDLGVVFSSAEVSHVKGPLANKIVVSRNRPPAVAGYIGEKLGSEVVGVGSAGAKAMNVLIGDYDAYVHAGGQYEWDQAAPVGVALAAGLHASRLTGDKLVYNNSDTYIPDLLICRPELADDILGLASDYLDQHGSFLARR